MTELQYNRPLLGYGELFTVPDFKIKVQQGQLTDSDGFGEPVRDAKVADLEIKPSNLSAIPPLATHILWYNSKKPPKKSLLLPYQAKAVKTARQRS